MTFVSWAGIPYSLHNLKLRDKFVENHLDNEEKHREIFTEDKIGCF